MSIYNVLSLSLKSIFIAGQTTLNICSELELTQYDDVSPYPPIYDKDAIQKGCSEEEKYMYLQKTSALISCAVGYTIVYYHDGNRSMVNASTDMLGNTHDMYRYCCRIVVVDIGEF